LVVSEHIFPILKRPQNAVLFLSWRGLEQNADTKSRCAQMARADKRVMQFLSESRYVANVVDGKATFCGHRNEGV
jgi:hypothetical protein